MLLDVENIPDIIVVFDGMKKQFNEKTMILADLSHLFHLIEISITSFNMKLTWWYYD